MIFKFKTDVYLNPANINKKIYANQSNLKLNIKTALTYSTTGLLPKEYYKIVNKNGTKIIGISNVMNKLPLTASNLYAKNLFNFVYNLYDKKKKSIFLNEEDEIVSKTLITKEL